MKRGALPRLSLLGFAGLGFWLWRHAPFLPHERELSWTLGRARAGLQGAEIQIYSPEGELLKREAWSFEQEAPASLRQEVTLREGDYPARLFLSRSDGTREVRTSQLRIADEREVFLSVDTAVRVPQP